MRGQIFMEVIQIGTVGVEKSLSKYTPLKSLVEYIWNGFDAKATKIDITCDVNQMGTVCGIRVEDNGYGISKKQLNKKFKPFFQSEKQINPDEVRDKSTIHGKNGIGRLTFFTFADKATWETVYEDEEHKYKYRIEIEKNKLDRYESSDEIESDEDIGTKVYFEGINGISVVDEVIDYIKKEFCWFLELNSNKQYVIRVNKKDINYADLIEKTIMDRDNNGIINFNIKYVVWKEKLQQEYSRYYYINSNGEELFKENTSLNNKGDKFYHSVYIESNLFDDFHRNKVDGQISLIGYNYSSKEFVYIKEKVDKELRRIRKPFINKCTNRIIEDLEKIKAFPNYDSNNVLDRIKKSEIEKVVREVYKIQPQIFSGLNIPQKKTLVRFLDLIMQSGERESLFNILEEIVELDKEERDGLADILKRAKLSNIIKTLKLIEDRYRAVEQLKELVFNQSMNANEVKHIQGFIENHYWLFGEQYHLVTSAEPKFEEALRRFIYHTTGKIEDVKINHPDKMKEMDIFAVRQNIGSNEINNIVIELKHPQIRLGEEQLSQVKKYMNVIMKQDRFNADNMTWEFILVGNKFDTTNFIQYEIENNKSHGERSLVYKVGKYKIYVKTWSEVFNEFEIKHKFLNEKLQLEREKLNSTYSNADEILEDSNSNLAIQPKEVEIGQSVK